jgi:hypothetical protein
MPRCYVGVELECAFVVEYSFIAGEGERSKGGNELGLCEAVG